MDDKWLKELQASYRNALNEALNRIAENLVVDIEHSKFGMVQALRYVYS